MQYQQMEKNQQHVKLFAVVKKNNASSRLELKKPGTTNHKNSYVLARAHCSVSVGCH